MKKRKPSHDLAAVKAVFVSPERLNATWAAYEGMADLGLSVPEAVEVLQAMSPRHFHHSVSSFADHREWQNVYLVPATLPSGGTAIVYVKFRADLIFEFKLLSFKEKDGPK